MIDSPRLLARAKGGRDRNVQGKKKRSAGTKRGGSVPLGARDAVRYGFTRGNVGIEVNRARALVPEHPCINRGDHRTIDRYRDGTDGAQEFPMRGRDG